MLNPSPRTAVEWSTPDGVRVGTVVDADAVGPVPVGHTPVRILSGVLNVMTIALRPYTPSVESLAEMRSWLVDCAPADDVDLVADLTDTEVLRATVHLLDSRASVALFV